jgi:hypothetical protein
MRIAFAPAALALSLPLAAQQAAPQPAQQQPAHRTPPALHLVRASHGFGQLLPHRIHALDGAGQPTAQIVDIAALADLVQHSSALNPVLPASAWPTLAVLPNGAAGNHYVAIHFDLPLDALSVLDPSGASASVAHLTGAISVTALDPETGSSVPIAGRAFVGGTTVDGSGASSHLQKWVHLDLSDSDGDGNLIEPAVLGGAMPGLGFPGTVGGLGAAFVADLTRPSTFVFVPDVDGNLSTFETLPAAREIRVRISTAVLSLDGVALAASGLACATVGADTLKPAIAFGPPPFGAPLISPGNGDVNVDPATSVQFTFTEPIEPASVGVLEGTGAPGLGLALGLQFGPGSAAVQMPYTCRPPSVLDLSVWELLPAFAFPGSGPVGACSAFNGVLVEVHANALRDLAGNLNQLAAATTFSTGPGVALVNAPVAPDAIYVARVDGGLSVIDLNGFGQSTGDPTYDPLQPITQGNSNFPNNPNVALQGALMIPPLAPGDCTYDGGSAGVFTLTRDSNLSNRLVGPESLQSLGDMHLGHALDQSYNAGPPPFGCQAGGGNLCAITGLQLLSASYDAASQTVVPANQGAPLQLEVGKPNVISWAPHPNPPPLVFPPLCVAPHIGGQQPTSVLATLAPPSGLGLVNLLAPGANYLGNPSLGLPPTNLLSPAQNAHFVGPDVVHTQLGACLPYMQRQQIGHFLYAVDRLAGELVVLNSNRMQVLERIALPDPTSLAMSPNLDLLAVTNSLADSVSFVDIDPASSTFHQVVKEVAVGDGPRGIAWDPGNEDILVCNHQSNSVSILSAFSLAVRKTLANVRAPLDVAITQRQAGFGWNRNVYYAFILREDGKVALFESGPNGVNGWGYDEVIATTPYAFENAKAIQPDPAFLGGGVWIAHERKLLPDGTLAGLPGGALTNLRLQATISGQLPLVDPVPQLRAMDFEIHASIGSDVLSGIPIDIAFDDQRNLGALDGVQSVFGAGVPVAVNGKHQVRAVGGGVFQNTNEPALLFVAVPDSIEGPGAIDVLDLATLARRDTNPYVPGVQSIPVPLPRALTSYFRQ